MNYYIGIDLGTSSLKGILVNRDGEIIKSSSFDYDVVYPKDGWTEQNPKDWVKALNYVLNNLKQDHSEDIKGISFGGQMHGLVILDENDEVIRPCILWNDSRTQKQTDYLNEVIGKDKLSEYTGNIAFAGFTAPKILWLKENEPDNFNRVKKIMLPKDYLAYLLTGTFSTDYSDASGMLLLDVKNRCWSKEMLDVCGVTVEQLPNLYESYDVIGKVKAEYGLPNAIVTAGAGDNAAAAIGTGTIKNGDCNISLGTSGTIFISQDNFSVDNKNALHSFGHANGKYHLMGCILTAASARKWWLEDVLNDGDYNLDEKQVSECEDSNLIFLPYLVGERSPHNDTKIRGAFINIGATTIKAQMSKAIMEGVSFALKECLEVAVSNGLTIKETNLCGGGAKSKVWRQMIADIFNMPVKILVTEQGPSYGAAILAMIGNKEYDTLIDATNNIIKISETIYPNEEKVLFYKKKYDTFKKLYPLLRQLESD